MGAGLDLEPDPVVEFTHSFCAAGSHFFGNSLRVLDHTVRHCMQRLGQQRELEPQIIQRPLGGANMIGHARMLLSGADICAPLNDD